MPLAAQHAQSPGLQIPDICGDHARVHAHRHLTPRPACHLQTPAAAAPLTPLTRPTMSVSPACLNLIARGDRSGYWGYGKEYSREASLEAYKALVEAGLTFIDTVRRLGAAGWTILKEGFVARGGGDGAPSMAARCWVGRCAAGEPCVACGASCGAPQRRSSRHFPLCATPSQAEVYGFGLSETFLGEFIKEVRGAVAGGHGLRARCSVGCMWHLQEAQAGAACMRMHGH
jgi:hypothetical protein